MADARARRAGRHVAAEHPVPHQLHRQLGDRRPDARSAAASSPISATSPSIDRGAGQRIECPGPRARHRRRLVRRDARRALIDALPRHASAFEAAHLTVSRSRLAGRRRWRRRRRAAPSWCRPRASSSGRASRKDAYEIATLREAARRLSRGRARRARRRAPRTKRARGRAGDRLAHPPGRVRAHGV